MSIVSAKVDELAQRLARLTGEDLETALDALSKSGWPVSRRISPRIARP